jgi:tetratricopeptide (TPR) repeat protein
LTVRAWLLTAAQRYSEAVEEYETLHSLAPQDPSHLLNLSATLALTGRKEEALERIQQAVPMLPSPPSVILAAYLAQAGDEVGAREILEEALARREAGGSVAASGVAATYAILGDVDEALAWLERSFDEEGGVYWLRSPDWMNLWGEPRFHAIWDRLGLLGDPPDPPVLE